MKISSSGSLSGQYKPSPDSCDVVNAMQHSVARFKGAMRTGKINPDARNMTKCSFHNTYTPLI